MDTSDLADATPATGIVWAYRFRPDGAAEPIPQEKIEAVLTEIGGGWIWLHLGLADTRCRTRNAPQSRIWRAKSLRALTATCASISWATRLSA
jgi:hypothetical protein